MMVGTHIHVQFIAFAQAITAITYTSGTLTPHCSCTLITVDRVGRANVAHIVVYTCCWVLTYNAHCLANYTISVDVCYLVPLDCVTSIAVLFTHSDEAGLVALVAPFLGSVTGDAGCVHIDGSTNSTGVARVACLHCCFWMDTGLYVAGRLGTG